MQSRNSEKKLVKKKRLLWATAKMENFFFGRNNKSRSLAFRKFLFYQNIISFDRVMNLFLSCVMFSVKKVSFPTKTAVCVCVWGRGEGGGTVGGVGRLGEAIGAKWPKSIWKLQNQHFWVKTVGVTWGRQVNFSAIRETLLTELHIFFATKSTSFFSWIVFVISRPVIVAAPPPSA